MEGCSSISRRSLTLTPPLLWSISVTYYGDPCSLSPAKRWSHFPQQFDFAAVPSHTIAPADTSCIMYFFVFVGDIYLKNKILSFPKSKFHHRWHKQKTHLPVKHIIRINTVHPFLIVSLTQDNLRGVLDLILGKFETKIFIQFCAWSDRCGL